MTDEFKNAPPCREAMSGKSSSLFILDEHKNPVQEKDILAWGKWMEDADKKNLRTISIDEFDGVTVLTEFLGTKLPINALFETVVHGGKYHQHEDRYSTLIEAKEGHKRIVDMIKSDK